MLSEELNKPEKKCKFCNNTSHQGEFVADLCEPCDKRFKEKEIKVLDHGFVRLVDVMGDDSSIVQAARVSYGKGTKTVNEDRGLIRYLLRHKHTTPFEMVEFKFHMKLPIFLARQVIRHRTANVNEYSGRYSEMKDECYVPSSDRVTKQSSSNKQGGSEERLEWKDFLELSHDISTYKSWEDVFQSEQDEIFSNYYEYIAAGMRKELARINLPLSTYTEWYWKIDLHNLFHFLKLRMDSHAQWEIQEYARAMYELVKPVVPIASEAFEDYYLNSVQLTGPEVKVLQKIFWKPHVNIAEVVLEKHAEGVIENKRELSEFSEKFRKIFSEEK